MTRYNGVNYFDNIISGIMYAKSGGINLLSFLHLFKNRSFRVMECTIGVISKGSKTFMLKNFDYRLVPVAWAVFSSFGGYDHFALVDHDQQGVNSGLNKAGLALCISMSDLPGGKRLEKRTKINAKVLSSCNEVGQAVEMLKEFATSNSDMLGGNVLLADEKHIGVVEYFGGKVKTEVKEEGYIARANHSIFGLVKNYRERSGKRYEMMRSFLDELYRDLDATMNEEVVRRCKKLLMTEPILHNSTRSSFVIDVDKSQVYYNIRGQEWKTRKI